MNPLTSIVLLLILCVILAPAHALDQTKLDELSTTIEKAIADRQTPGAVLLFGNSKGILYEKAFGHLTYDPAAAPMQVNTIFDLASLSKPTGCASSVWVLIDRQKINLTDPVAKYLPAFGNNGKEAITVEQLLLHRGGLIPDNPMSDYNDGPEKALERIMQLKPKWPPGTHSAYTDVGFLVLGKLVEAVSGQTLDAFARENVFSPLKMNETWYHPPTDLRPRIAPTEKRKGEWIIGEVHDPRSYALGGVAGHAGVFSTAPDLARFCRMILSKGQLDGVRILSAESITAMTTPIELIEHDAEGKETTRSRRTRGFDSSTSYSSCRGERFDPNTSFGHTGYTGTMYWIDPTNDAFVILLTNRVHPDDKASVSKLRARVSTLAAQAMLD